MKRTSLAEKAINILVKSLSAGVARAVRHLIDRALGALAEGRVQEANELLLKAGEAVEVAQKLKRLGFNPEEFIGPEGVDWAKIAWYDETELLALLMKRDS